MTLTMQPQSGDDVLTGHVVSSEDVPPARAGAVSAESVASESCWWSMLLCWAGREYGGSFALVSGGRVIATVVPSGRSGITAVSGECYALIATHRAGMMHATTAK